MVSIDVIAVAQNATVPIAESLPAAARNWFR